MASVFKYGLSGDLHMQNTLQYVYSARALRRIHTARPMFNGIPERSSYSCREGLGLSAWASPWPAYPSAEANQGVGEERQAQWASHFSAVTSLKLRSDLTTFCELVSKTRVP